MVALAHPPAKPPTYVKVANYPGLYRHARSGRYYACKNQGGICWERSLGNFLALPGRSLQFIEVQNLFCEVDEHNPDDLSAFCWHRSLHPH